MTTRRDFITLLGGAAAWPLAARAQLGDRVRHVGILMDIYEVGDAEGQSRFGAFQETFQKLGWTVGRNVRIESRWAAGDPDRLRAFAAELAGRYLETPCMLRLPSGKQLVQAIFRGHAARPRVISGPPTI